MVPEEHEVLQAVKAFNRAFAANDPAAYFAFVDDALTLLLPSSPYRIEGKAPDREEFEYCLDRGWTRVGFFQELQPLVR
jgi:ketosteroid isomerase-like protein